MKKASSQAVHTKTQEAFMSLMERHRLPVPACEHRFHPERKWRFDYAWPDYLVALEVEGGAFTKGRHTRPMGFLADIEKYNRATALGWRVLRTVPDQLLSSGTIQTISLTLTLPRP